MTVTKSVLTAQCKKGLHWACLARVGEGPFASRCDCSCHRQGGSGRTDSAVVPSGYPPHPADVLAHIAYASG